MVQEVDGKQIQIQLTGFMEKNTAKFMRELWGLLLSAQQNASGVPQQFLDAKAEEIIKKKVCTPLSLSSFNYASLHTFTSSHSAFSSSLNHLVEKFTM